MRISWDSSFMAIALIGSLRSTCIKRRVGAVLVKGHRVIGTGYNGAPKGVPHCTLDTCPRLNLRSLEESKDCRGTHAEVNCLIQAAVHGTPCGGATAYVTRFPCMSCAKALINAGIREIIYLEESDMGNTVKMQMLRDANVTVRRYSGAPIHLKVGKVERTTR